MLDNNELASDLQAFELYEPKRSDAKIGHVEIVLAQKQLFVSVINVSIHFKS